jgi:phosphatidylglycerophosphate synthase
MISETMQRRIPWMLVMLRAILGPAIFVAAYFVAMPAILIGLLIAGLVSDIYDGVLARRWRVVTPGLRVADSRADVFFYACIGAAIAYGHPALAHYFRWPFRVILLLYVCRWGQDLLKYRRLASYHSYLSKATGLMVSTASCAAFASFHAREFFWAAFTFGVCNHLEAMMTTAVLPRWTHDVGSVRQALHLRGGA